MFFGKISSSKWVLKTLFKMVILLRWPFGTGSNVVHLVVDCIPQVFLLSISKFIFLVDKLQIECSSGVSESHQHE